MNNSEYFVRKKDVYARFGLSRNQFEHLIAHHLKHFEWGPQTHVYAARDLERLAEKIADGVVVIGKAASQTQVKRIRQSPVEHESISVLRDKVAQRLKAA